MLKGGIRRRQPRLEQPSQDFVCSQGIRNGGIMPTQTKTKPSEGS
jgi:hypothetical protein